MSFGIVASSFKSLGTSGGSDAYSTQVLSDTPLLYWRLNEPSGTIVNDSSGNGRNGVYNNSPSFSRLGLIQGTTDTCVYFDKASNQYASLASASWMNVGSMTITCIVQVGNSGLEMIVSRYHDPDNDRSWFLSFDGTFKFYVRGTDNSETVIDSNFTPLLGNVYYLAAYCSPAGAGLRVYDSTGLVGNTTAAGRTVNPSSRNLMLARSDDGTTYQLEAYIDDVAFYGTVLSTSRLDALASLALSPKPRWINRTSTTDARNGTTAHTLTFPPTQAGTLLVATVGATSSITVTSVGWTTRLSATSNTGLYLFTRNPNAGENTLQVVTAASNSLVNYTIYEFPVGTSYYSGTSQIDAGSFTTLSGLPGTPLSIFAVWQEDKNVSATAVETASWSYPLVKDVDMFNQSNGVTDGIYTTIAYRDFFNYTSLTPYVLLTNDSATPEQIMFAISVP